MTPISPHGALLGDAVIVYELEGVETALVTFATEDKVSKQLEAFVCTGKIGIREGREIRIVDTILIPPHVLAGMMEVVIRGLAAKASEGQ